MNNSLELICNNIENIRDNIYDYNLKVAFTCVNKLIAEMLDYVSQGIIPKDRISVFNTILENINISIQNKDYLLLSDILKFQLKDFVESL